MLPINKSSLIDNFYLGCRKGAYLFVTLKVPLLIIITLANSIFDSKIIYSSTKIDSNRLSFFKNVIIYPVTEEILFRGIIQPTIQKVASILIITLGTQNEEYKRNLEDISKRISKTINSILFGLAHYPFGGPMQAFSAGLGTYYGEAELMNKRGLVASIGCHISNNFFCELLSLTINKFN